MTQRVPKPRNLEYRFQQIHWQTNQGLLVAFGSYRETPEFSGFDHEVRAVQFLLLIPNGQYLRQLEYPDGEYQDEIDLQSEWEALQVYDRLDHKIVQASHAFAALGRLFETEGIEVIRHWPGGLVPTLDQVLSVGFRMALAREIYQTGTAPQVGSVYSCLLDVRAPYSRTFPVSRSIAESDIAEASQILMELAPKSPVPEWLKTRAALEYALYGPFWYDSAGKS